MANLFYIDLSQGKNQLSKIYGTGACIAEVFEDPTDEISANMAMHETIVSVDKVSVGVRFQVSAPLPAKITAGQIEKETNSSPRSSQRTLRKII